jgi:hypothetical protein
MHWSSNSRPIERKGIGLPSSLTYELGASQAKTGTFEVSPASKAHSFRRHSFGDDYPTAHGKTENLEISRFPTLGLPFRLRHPGAPLSEFDAKG